MKLRNKKTGELGIPRVDYQEFYIDTESNTKCRTYCYKTLDAMYCEWEDYTEEPKEYWCIDWTGGINHITVLDDVDEYEENKKEIGNYFETKEKAKKALEKLRAWKRLKDKGFKADLWDYDGGNYQERIRTGRILFRVKDYEENDTDLDLLFGGEE